MKMNRLLGIILIMLLTIFLGAYYLITYKGFFLYGLQNRGNTNSSPFQKQRFETYTSAELLNIIDNVSDISKYPEGHYQRYAKAMEFKNAIQVLAGRTDELAVKKLNEIILKPKQPGEWRAISSIGINKNRVMIPSLCAALSQHRDNHTDWLIVQALSQIDDRSALDSLVLEKDKLKFSYAIQLAERTIDRWRAAS